MTIEWRLWLAVLAAITGFVAVFIGLARGQEQHAAPVTPQQPGQLIAIDLSNLAEFRAFAFGIGAREERQPWSARHKAQCEWAGWGWSGSWVGPSGSLLAFCINGNPAEDAMGEYVCAWAGLAFHHIEDDRQTLVCMRSPLGAGDAPLRPAAPQPQARLISTHAPSLARLDFQSAFPARYCAASGDTLFPAPWAFARSQSRRIAMTCWNPDHVRDGLRRADPNGWEERWDAAISKPEGWEPLDERGMDYLCRSRFNERLAPVWGEPMTPEVAARRYAWLQFGWWWCEPETKQGR